MELTYRHGYASSVTSSEFGLNAESTIEITVSGLVVSLTLPSTWTTPGKYYYDAVVKERKEYFFYGVIGTSPFTTSCTVEVKGPSDLLFSAMPISDYQYYSDSKKIAILRASSLVTESYKLNF